MSQGTHCTCKPRDKKNWVVVDRHCNYSAFNGYRGTHSAYSAVRCLVCLFSWRTKSDYVASLPDLNSRA